MSDHYMVSVDGGNVLMFSQVVTGSNLPPVLWWCIKCCVEAYIEDGNTWCTGYAHIDCRCHSPYAALGAQSLTLTLTLLHAMMTRLQGSLTLVAAHVQV